MENYLEILLEVNPDILLCDGLEDALIGFVEVQGKTVALYDSQRCIEIFQERDGMTEEEAFEYFSFNVAGAYMGENTPAFATLFRRK